MYARNLDVIGQNSPNILALSGINFASVEWILAKIRAVRREMKISQEEIADLIGIDQKTYGNWETGRTEMTLSNLDRIAKALKVPVSYFWDQSKFEQENDTPSMVKEPEAEYYKDLLLKSKDELIAQQKEHIKLLQEKLSRQESTRS